MLFDFEWEFLTLQYFTGTIKMFDYKRISYRTKKQKDLTALDERHTYNKGHDNRDLNQLQ